MRVSKLARRTVCLGALLLAGCGSSGEPEAARTEDSAPPPANAAAAVLTPAAAEDEAALLRLEQDYAKALIARDRAFLMRFYASDWRGGNWLGFWSKATMLQSVLDARYVTKSMTVRDMKVRVIGDVAIVQGVDEEVTSVDGKDTSGKWAFTDIFARRDGRWEAIASHTSEIRPTGK
jgi:ketosteroid isomerase-like protein